jgi:hypothetical protein
MSQLEAASKPLVTSMVRAEHQGSLSASEQIRLATWGYKTGIMLAVAHPEDQRWVPREHYRYLYENRKPPNGVHIWIAALVPEHPDGSGLRTGWSTGERLDFWRGDETLDRQGYRLTFSVIALVFQIVFEPYGNKLGRPRETRDIWTRIRPVSKGDWPPRRWFTTDALPGLVGGKFINAN